MSNNFEVIIFAKVRVKICNVKATSPLGAVERAFKEAHPEELNHLFTREYYAPWESLFHSSQLEEKAPLLFMVKEDPDDESGQIPNTTWWQLDPSDPSTIKPMTSVFRLEQFMQDALKFFKLVQHNCKKALRFLWPSR